MKKTAKWYLIQRFLVVLFCVYWSGVLIDLLYRKALAPVILSFLESQKIEITGSGDILTWILRMLFYFLFDFLPPGIREWMQSQVDMAMGSSMRIEVTSPLYDGVWGVALRFMIIGGIIVIFLSGCFPIWRVRFTIPEWWRGSLTRCLRRKRSRRDLRIKKGISCFRILPMILKRPLQRFVGTAGRS